MKSFILTQPEQASLGKLVFSCGVNALIEDNELLVTHLVRKLELYRGGDWGDICEEDWQCNIDTIKSPESGGRIMGAYKLYDGTKIWIMTAGYGNHKLGIDYCYTTVLFPSEY